MPISILNAQVCDATADAINICCRVHKELTAYSFFEII